jgi:XTP/dITP diphosphohydrolase
MTALLIASRNAHKAREIQRILAADYQCLTLQDFPGAPATVEDGATFAANAAKKVSALADWLAAKPPSWVAERALLARRPRHPQPAPSTSSTPSMIPPPREPGREDLSPLLFYLMADDSGLEVDALGGAPGVHSARFSALDGAGADNSPDRANNAKLLRLLKGVPAARRTARFRCVLALRRLSPPFADGSVLFEGVCEGRIGLQPAGVGGFGYDPLFIPEGCSQSFAELGDAVKNSLSHRALALEKLRECLAKHGSNP